MVTDCRGSLSLPVPQVPESLSNSDPAVRGYSEGRGGSHHLSRQSSSLQSSSLQSSSLRSNPYLYSNRNSEIHISPDGVIRTSGEDDFPYDEIVR
jgi:hypothetical protein